MLSYGRERSFDPLTKAKTEAAGKETDNRADTIDKEIPKIRDSKVRSLIVEHRWRVGESERTRMVIGPHHEKD